MHDGRQHPRDVICEGEAYDAQLTDAVTVAWATRARYRAISTSQQAIPHDGPHEVFDGSSDTGWQKPIRSVEVKAAI